MAKYFPYNQQNQGNIRLCRLKKIEDDDNAIRVAKELKAIEQGEDKKFNINKSEKGWIRVL